MVNVCIQKDLFPAGESLFDILAIRMATVSWNEAAAPAAKTDSAKVDASPKPIDAYLCSGAFAEKQGGIPTIVEMAKVNAGQKTDGC